MGRQKLYSSFESATIERKQRHIEIKKQLLSDDDDAADDDDDDDDAQLTDIDEQHQIEQIKPNKRLRSSSSKEDTVHVDNDSSPSPVEQRQAASAGLSRPKRKATNAHFFRYLQTRNPSRLEEEDLRRALEASLEECPDYWPEDSASCSSSDQSNAPSSSADSSTGGGDTNGICNGKNCKYNRRNRRTSSNACCSRSSSSASQQVCSSHTTMQHNHLNQCNHHCQNMHPYSHTTNHPATNCHTTNCGHPSYQCCPYASVHKRYKPVAKKNIYDEADFFHDGIMEYIEYELMKREGVLG